MGNPGGGRGRPEFLVSMDLGSLSNKKKRFSTQDAFIYLIFNEILSHNALPVNFYCTWFFILLGTFK